MQNDDLLLVNRAGGSYKTEYTEIKQDIIDSVPSTEVSATPPTGAEEGDLWWDTTDGRLYVYYDDGSSEQWVDASPDAQAPVVISAPSAPTNSNEGDLWWNTTDGRLYIYYDDGDSEQWVEASPQKDLSDTYVEKTGDTMTGDLTVPNITVPGTITSAQAPAAMVNFGINMANNISINGSFNVARVEYVGNLGQYRIIYDTPLTGQTIGSLTAVVGVINGGASYVNFLTGGANQSVIATLSVQPNGTLAAEASTYYNFVVWAV